MLGRWSRKKGPVPLSILTGFLGSGKTTILNRALSNPSLEKTAIIINEFGEVGIDNLIAKQVDEKMMILTTGCICCTVRGDILSALRELFDRRAKREIPWFERLMVETTGLANPAPVVHALVASTAARTRVYLDTLATAVDCVLGEETLEQHTESVQQVALADVLLMSKSDLAEPTAIARLEERLTELNPRAQRVFTEDGFVDDGLLFGRNALKPNVKSPNIDFWLGESSKIPEHAHGHSDSIRTWTLYRDVPFSDAEFHRFFKKLSSLAESRLLRVKGIIHVQPQGPVLVHGVQHAFYPPKWLAKWPSKDHRSRLVFISKGLSREDLGFVARGFQTSDDVAPQKSAAGS